MIARRRSLMVLTWVALAALVLSWTPAAGESIFPQPLADVTIAADGGHPTNSTAGQVMPDSVTIEVPIAAGSDDAGVNAAWDWCFYGANHNEIYFGQCADGADITSGFRFNPIAIPRGAHIVEAHIRFTVDGPYTGAMTVRFRGEASGNAAPFDDVSRPDNRHVIPNVMADWQITPSDPWTLGETRNSPPLTAIVQAIVDRGDWSSGNALAIITQNVGTATGNWRHRRVIGYERPVWFPGTEYAARLVVTYGEQPPPPSPAPDWSAFGGQEGADYGLPVATAGDINGDGYGDVIVGAPHYDDGEVDEGRAFVYYGTSAGLNPTPNWITESNQAGALFGYPVSTAGDVNGDGYADVIVGAQSYDAPGTTDAGRAYIYFGSASGLSTTPNRIATGDQTGDQFGVAVDTAGDINGDGYADIIVGANTYDNGETDEGRAYVFYGSPSGPSVTPDWMAEVDHAGAYFGSYLGTAGDVNGDGCADVIIGAWGYDHVFGYFGSASGLSNTPNWTVAGDQSGSRFGTVSTAGDVNGDGYADVIVGADRYTGANFQEGRAFVYYGSASGPSTTPNWTVSGGQWGAWLGHGVSTAGDVNGDGYGDVIVGAQAYDNDQTNEGRAWIYYGSASGLETTPAWTAESNRENSAFGYEVSTAGDVDGDGYADVIVGDYYYTNVEAHEGAAFVYHGGPDGLSATADWMTEGSHQYSAHYGMIASAGDVNGDGYADVAVGEPDYDGDQWDEGRADVYYGSAAGLSPIANWTAEGGQDGAKFGGFAGTAGDVNGDGYDDLVVGASRYDNGQTDEGRVFVFYGSANGLSASADWTAESDQDATEFGERGGTAGDVNGDGYADLIVGAWRYDNGQTDEGRVLVYHGSANGLSTTPDWTAESDQASEYFGKNVATAGDVNGDGYSDVVVGAYGYDNGQDAEGRAYVFYGSPTGLSTTPNWTAESNQAGAHFGHDVGRAGDVNGDGYADLAVGAIDYDHGQANEGRGRAFVYYGSALGLSATADWTAEGDQDGARFSYPVVTAGDVNGDGYADLAVDAPYYDNGQIDEGRAFVYFGSANGLGTTPNWTAESDQADAALYPVGTAGDINGDGYADLVIGDTNYTGVQWRDGRAFAYYGNQGGLSLRPQQRRSDNTVPIAFLGKSDQRDRFRLALLGRTPFGRGKVKLEWEVKQRGVLFDGTGTQRSAAWVDTGTAGVQLDELIGGLQQDTLYHWRMRLLFHPATTPFQQTSRWLTNPWNGWNEARLRTAGPPTMVKLATLEATPGPSSRLPGWSVLALIGLSLGAGAVLAKRRLPQALRH